MFKVGGKYKSKGCNIIRSCEYVGESIIVLKNVAQPKMEYPVYKSGWRMWEEYMEPQKLKPKFYVFKDNISGEIQFIERTVFGVDRWEIRQIGYTNGYTTLIDIWEPEWIEKVKT